MPDSINDFENDDILAASLGRLPREKMPPASLEDATVATLRRSGLLHARVRRGINLASWMLAAGIGAIAFVGGSMFAGRGSSLARGGSGMIQVVDTQPQFQLLLYGATSDDDSITQVRRTSEYTDWAAATPVSARYYGGKAPGAPVSAVALRTDGRVTDSVIVDEEPVDPNDLVGYFVVSAPTREAAVRLALNCPHLKYGGRVVVRRFYPDGK